MINIHSTKEEVLLAVAQDGLLLQHVSDALRNDPDVVIAATRNYWGALRYASNELKSNKEFIKLALHIYDEAFSCASDELKNDKEFVKELIAEYGILSFHYASPEVRGDRVVLMAAIAKSGVAFQWGSKELRNDEEVFMAALPTFPSTLLYAADTLLPNNKRVVMASVTACGMMLQFASKALRDDADVAKAAFNKDKRAKQYASQRLQPYLHYLANSNLCLIESCTNKAIYKDVVKEKVDSLLQHMDTLYRNGEASITDLTTVFEHTFGLLRRTCSIQRYKDMANSLILNRSPGLQILGGLMIALGVAIAGLSVAMAVTGFGIASSAIGSVASIALVASGMSIFAKGQGKSNHELSAELHETANVAKPFVY